MARGRSPLAAPQGKVDDLTFREIAAARVVGSEGTRQEGWTQGGTPFDPPNCQAVTKKGGPCSARRAHGTMYCIGHLRSMGNNGDAD